MGENAFFSWPAAAVKDPSAPALRAASCIVQQTRARLPRPSPTCSRGPHTGGLCERRIPRESGPQSRVPSFAASRAATNPCFVAECSGGRARGQCSPIPRGQGSPRWCCLGPFRSRSELRLVLVRTSAWFGRSWVGASTIGAARGRGARCVFLLICGAAEWLAVPGCA